MDEKTKQGLIIALAVVAVGFAAFMGFQTLKPESAKVNVVGELDMGTGGGRDTERGANREDNAADAAGMPADMR